MSNKPMQAVFKDLQDSLIVMAQIENRQTRIRSEKDQASFEANVAEIADKLNRLMRGNRDLNDDKGKIES
jgi:hypothetical protein